MHHLKALQLNEGTVTNLKKCFHLTISFVHYNKMPGRLCEILLYLAVWWGYAVAHMVEAL
jgi:hypothetical protein